MLAGTQTQQLQIQNGRRLGPLAVAPHDFAEDEPKHFRRRLIIARKPAATRPRIDASEMRKVRFGFIRPRHSREIAKADRRLDISVRNVRRL